MRTLIIILLISFSTMSQAQETSSFKNKSKTFVALFNLRASDSIYNMFSSEMKEALPKDKVNQVVNSLHYQLGNIKNIQFIKMNEGRAKYKANFKNAPMFLIIALNDKEEISGLLFQPYKENTATVLERNITPLKLPFKGKWNIFWGGETEAQNYHVKYENQKGAFDILIFDEKGKSHKGNGTKNEDYYAFGKPIIAPCDAEVVLAVDGVKDNIPGELNPTFLTGNTVILKTKNNEYLLFAHFKQNSVAVKQGNKVRTGDLLGLCGNSGNSTEAHLHFHIQNVEAMHDAVSAKCYFDKILVNGAVKTNYMPVKNDAVENVSE